MGSRFNKTDTLLSPPAGSRFSSNDIRIDEPVVGLYEGQPNETDVEKVAKDVFDFSTELSIPLDIAEFNYNEMAKIADPDDLPEPTSEVKQPLELRAAPEEKTLLKSIFGYEGLAKPEYYWNMNSIKRAAFDAYMAGRHILTRVGGKIVTELGLANTKEINDLYNDELVNNPKWFQKSPEGLGWSVEKAAEFYALKGLFKVTGLTRALGAIGAKLSQPFLTKEIVKVGGAQALKTLSKEGLKRLGKDALVAFLRFAPENTAFLTTWSVAGAVLKKGEFEEGQKQVVSFVEQFNKNISEAEAILKDLPFTGSEQETEQTKKYRQVVIDYLNEQKPKLVKLKEQQKTFGAHVSESAWAGTLWGIGLSALGPVVGASGKILGATKFGTAVKLTASRAYTEMWRKFPRLMNAGKRPFSDEFLAESKKQFRARFGIEPTPAQEAQLKKLTRLVGEEITKAAKKEAVLNAYWNSGAKKAQDVAKEAERAAAEAAKVAKKPPVRPTEVVKPKKGAITPPKAAEAAELSLPIPKQHKDAPVFWERLHQRRETGQSALSQEEEIVVQQIRDSSDKYQKAVDDYSKTEFGTPESKKAGRKVQQIEKDIDLEVSQIPIDELRKRLPAQTQPVSAEAVTEGKVEARISKFAPDVKIIRLAKTSLHNATFDEGKNTITLYSNATPESVEHELRHKAIWDLTHKGNFSFELNNAIDTDGKDLAKSYMKKIEEMEGFEGVHPQTLRKEVMGSLLKGYISDSMFAAKLPEVHKVFSKYVTPELYSKLTQAPAEAVTEAAKSVVTRQRNAGFLKLPPVSVVNEIGAEHPNIDVPLSQKDIGILQNTILTPVNQAQNTRNPTIIRAAETMATTGMEMNNDIQAALRNDQAIYKTLPKEYRADRGAKFFELMDKHFSPSEIDADKSIPAKVKSTLKHFKMQDEATRQEVIKQKRELRSLVNQKKTLVELQAMARKAGIKVTKKGKPKKIDKKPTTTIVNKTKVELSNEFAIKQVPDDWGKQWSHIQHIFFGQYNLFYEELGEKGLEKHFIGRAETRAEAYRKLLDWKMARKAEGHKDYDTIKLAATPELNIPLDVLRLTKAQYGILRNQLQRAAEIDETEISDALHGIIGLKAKKQKWWGALLKRKGKAGFSTDFLKVWEAQTTQFQRWKHLTQMNKDVEPLIEAVKGQGLTGWANYLEDTKDFIWGTKRTVASKALDQLFERTPILGDYVKPFALERWASHIKAFQYWTKLQTGRFYVLNSLQPLQTLWPVVGTKGVFRGYGLYYSKKGQALLKKHKVFGVAGKLHETLAARGRKFERFLPAGASEIRNQGVAFLALYDYARKQIQYSELEAARYGALRGQLFTQFAYTGGDVPRAMRGPIGGTILQFKRFQIKNLELFSRLIREGRYGGAARWVTALALVGGLKALTSSIAALLGGGYIAYKLYNSIKKEYGEDVANIVAFGLPALVGVDMSGSISPIDVPYGRTIPEKIGNTVLGPSGQQIVKLVTDMASNEVAKEVGLANRALDSLAQSSPTIKQFQFLTKALEQDTATFDAKQRKQYELEIEDLWKKAFGFRPVDESEQRLFIEAFHAVKNEYDDIADSVALDLIELNELSQGTGGLPDNYSKWPDESKTITDRIQKKLRNWQATYPEFPITSESILTRVKNKTRARQYTQLQREWLQLSKNLRGAFAQDVAERNNE